MADLSTSQKRAEARALEDRLIGFMKENNLTKAQLLETMEKMVDDQDTTSTATEQSNTLSMYAATVAARKVVNEFHKSIEQLEKDLMPGTFSNVWFLQPGQSFVRTIAEDLGACEQHGISHLALADEMDQIIARFRLWVEGFPEYVTNHGAVLTISGFGTRGSQANPFTSEGPTSSSEITIKSNDKEFTLTEMHPRMARELGFFEGKWTRYRVDPVGFAQMVGLIK